MAHIHEKIDFTASVYIVYQNKVLLHLHTKTNKWMPPGGHIELDEDPNQAVLREALEESGLKVTLKGNQGVEYVQTGGELGVELVAPRFMNRHFYKDSETHEHVDLVYFGTSDTDMLGNEAAENGMRWFTADEIERNDIGMIPRIHMYARAALKELAS